MSNFAVYLVHGSNHQAKHKSKWVATVQLVIFAPPEGMMLCSCPRSDPDIVISVSSDEEDQVLVALNMTERIS